MISLKYNQNLLVDYDPEWPSLFEAERDRLQGVLLDIPQGLSIMAQQLSWDYEQNQSLTF